MSQNLSSPSPMQPPHAPAALLEPERALRDQKHHLPAREHKARLRGFAAATEGSTMIEYALIASLVAMVILSALRELGTQIVGLPLAAIIAAFAANPESDDHVKIAVKFLVAFAIAGLAEVGRKKEAPRTFWMLIGVLTLVNVIVAVVWR